MDIIRAEPWPRCSRTELTLLSPLGSRRLYHLLHLRNMAQRGSHVRSLGGRGENHGGWLGQLQMTARWAHGHLGNRCSRGSRARGVPKRCPRLSSNAETRKHNVGIPGPVAAACSLLRSAVKRDGKEKSRTSGMLPAALSANPGLCASPPPSPVFYFNFIFYFLVRVERKRLLCAS